jgi:hypothetical protein
MCGARALCRSYGFIAYDVLCLVAERSIISEDVVLTYLEIIEVKILTLVT